MEKNRLSVILPTYNERGNIVRLIRSIASICTRHKISTEVIVVDDNSPDGTGQKAKNHFKKNRNVRVFVRISEKGLATAIKMGIKKAHGTFILVMDTDFNHNPKEIPKFLEKVHDCRLVIGSRFVKDGGMENQIREKLSWLFNLYLRFLLQHGVHDNLSGFFVMRKKDLLSFNLNTLFYGFGDYFMRLVYKVHTRGFSIYEVPVFYKNRTSGVSKSRFLPMFISYTFSALRLRLENI